MSLAEFNELKAVARRLGIDVKGMKKPELESLVTAYRAAEKAKLKECPDCGGEDINRCHCDPFDDIQPEIEGDHLIGFATEVIPPTDAEKMIYREDWLWRGIRKLQPLAAQGGCTFNPDKIYVSVGFGKGRKADAVCFPTHCNAAGMSNVFVSPTNDDPVKILAFLLHELGHVSDDCKSGHNGHFAEFHKQVGFIPPRTDSKVGPELETALKEIAIELGPYPHVKMELDGNVKKQKTYMLKLSCKSCEYICRTTQKCIDMYDSFPCPCGETMAVEQKGE